MASNYKQPGEVLDLTAPYDVASGAGMLIGTIFAVALGEAAEAAAVRGQVTGVWTLVKATGTAWTAGDAIYWDNSAKKCTKTAAANTLVGVATEDAASGATTGVVRLSSLHATLGEAAQAANVAALTDSSGGAAADGTIALVTAPTAIAATLTDSTGLSGTHDDTLAATAVPVDLTGGESPTEAEHNALLAVNRVMAQNISDVAQKAIELVTAQGQDRTAIIALTDAVAELAAKINAEIAALKTAGLQAAS